MRLIHIEKSRWNFVYSLSESRFILINSFNWLNTTWHFTNTSHMMKNRFWKDSNHYALIFSLLTIPQFYFFSSPIAFCSLSPIAARARRKKLVLFHSFWWWTNELASSTSIETNRGWTVKRGEAITMIAFWIFKQYTLWYK